MSTSSSGYREDTVFPKNSVSLNNRVPLSGECYQPALAPSTGAQVQIGREPDQPTRNSIGEPLSKLNPGASKGGRDLSKRVDHRVSKGERDHTGKIP